MEMFLMLVLLLIPAVDGILERLSGYQVCVPYQIILSEGIRTYHKNLTTLHKGSHKPVVEYMIECSNKTFHLDLNQQDLLNLNRRDKQGDDATLQRSKDDLERCHYQGHLKNSTGNAIISTCDEILFGTIIDEADNCTYYIHYVVDINQHIIYKPSDFLGKPSVSYYQDSNVMKPRRRRQVNFRRFLDVSLKKKYLSIAVLTDEELFYQFGNDSEKVSTYVLSIINHANHIFKSTNIQIVLTHLEIWTKNRFNVTKHLSRTLHLLARYDLHVLKKELQLNHDAVHLISGIKHHVLAGLGQYDMVCYGTSAGMTINWMNNPSVVANTLAHELGHNFGLFHDRSNCQCENKPCVMSPYASWSMAQGWSDCSLKALDKRCKSGGCFCLMDAPGKAYNGPKCGNGLVEIGEECDCGPEYLCDNPCCNATSCKHYPEAECAEGRCCHYCTIAPKGEVCRQATDECDIEEKCDGKNSKCPKDVHMENYSSCKNDSYCHNGKCSYSLDEHCKMLYGPDHFHGTDECKTGLTYRNMRGDQWGNCGKLDNGEYLPCQLRDVKCGKIQCWGGKVPSWIKVGRRKKVVYYSGNQKLCHSGQTFVGNDVEDITLPRDGTKCDDGKICHSRQCVETTVLRETLSACHEKCGEHGRCTSEGYCYCHAGFKCPRCALKDPTNLHGRLCKHAARNSKPEFNTTCFCQNGGKCDSEGVCFCRAGYKCPDCADVDDKNINGQLCRKKLLVDPDGVPALPCQHDCANGGVCNLFTRSCTCPPSTQCPNCRRRGKSLSKDPITCPAEKEFLDLKCEKHMNFKVEAFGCKSKRGRSGMTLLRNFRYAIEWEAVGFNLEQLLCKCIQVASDNGYKFVMLQFWGECWVTKNFEDVRRLEKGTDCVKQNYDDCRNGDELCDGRAKSGFAYRILPF